MKAFWNLYRELLAVLPPTARRFMIGYAVSLGLLSVLDAAALALLAAIIGPILTGSQLTLPLLGEVSDEGLIIMLGLVCLLVIGKAVIAVLLLWRATRRFAAYELALGARLFDTYVAASWVERLRRNSSDLVRLVDQSVALTISSFLLPASSLAGELLSFVTVVAVLAIAQPVIAVIALVYLGAIGALLFFWVTKRSRQSGQVNIRYSLRVSRLITEMIGALKEISLRNKVDEVALVVRENRVHATRARQNAVFLSQMPRYVLESGIIGGFVLVGVAGYLMGGVTGAGTAVALFSLAGFRMAPSIIRFQSIVSQMTVSTPHARAVLDEIRRSEATTADQWDRPERPMPAEPSRLAFESVTFQYAPGSEPAVKEVTLDIAFGSSVAFVGASGAGKSTMVDLTLGLIEPTQGAITVDGVPLTELTSAWRSRVGYVPQDVALFDASVAQNVALTWRNDFDDERVRSALAQAQLLDTVESRDGGIHARVGERGLALSGGQRQRLGIARALYAEPLVLVMDEATSALDTATEAAVSEAITKLRGTVTIITVAHRLATVMHADDIVFMRDGRVVDHGTFSDLIARVPDFAIQARLAGLGED